MPWYGFTKYGVIDVPDIVSPVFTGQIYLYASSSKKKDLPATGLEPGTPTGFLRCNGQEVLIADHQNLYDFFVNQTIPLSFGTPSDGDHFVLPNFTNNFPIGLNPADTGADADPSIDLSVIGITGGAIAHSHTGTGSHTHPNTPTHGPHEVSSHKHGLNSHTHDLLDHTHGKGGIRMRQTVPVDSSADNVRNAAGTTLRHGSLKWHDHSITGLTGGSGTANSTIAKNTSNGSIFVTQSAGGNNTSGITTIGASTPSANPSAPNVSSPSLPPYYSLYFIIKD